MTAADKARREVAEFLQQKRSGHYDELNFPLTEFMGVLANAQAFGAGVRVEFANGEPTSLEEWEREEAAGNIRSLLTGDNEARMESLVSQARTDPVSWEACAIVAKALMGRGEALPSPLAKLAVEALSGEAVKPRPIGRNRLKNRPRDMVIQLAVYKASQHGIPAYANGESKGITACGIVSEELASVGVYLSAHQVASIWKNRPYD